MADTKDYLSVYRRFFEEFAATVNPDDQLPVKVAGYYLCDSELVGEIVDWTLQYLNQKHCPSSLLAPLTRTVIEEIKLACKKHPTACGYRSGENTYQPLKLMQVVTGKVNEICLRYRDNGKLATLPPPSPGPPISSCAIKNTRRRMEDRHVVIEDFHAIFSIQDRSPTSYYAVFDGHAGTDAAVYSVSHLHQFLAESSYYPTDPERALKDAFSRTDSLFLEKSNRENLRSGTTAVCALLRHKEKMLYVAWLGDSQAVLVREGTPVQVVNPHKPDRQDERERIELMGGCVLFWGTWRVNGQLAVSRAIGDLEYKPYVTSEPDVRAVPLDGTEDFLILACDGLWDFVSEQEAVEAAYQQIHESPGDLEAVSQRLVQLSKAQGSTDNISVIVVFLTDPAQLASRPVDVWANLSKKQAPSNTMDTSNNPFTTDSVPYQKAGLLLDLGGAGDVYKQNGTSPSANDLYFLDRPANGKGNFDDDDFGPETDVDAVDDVLLSPAKIVSSQRNNNPFEDNENEKSALDADLELQRQQLSDFDPVREPREETPTPPADEVPGVTNLVPESDNVAESGEDSEDEWNYYRVEPSAETNQQSAQKVCDKPAQPQIEDDEADMESQLNPDAAEFVPSPTQLMPKMEDILLAESPKKGIPMENIAVPTHLEFQNEISQRPSELNRSDDLEHIAQQKIAAKLPDLINTEGGDVNPFPPPGAICGKSLGHLENGSAFKDFLEQGDRNFQELQNNSHAADGLLLDESEVSSTKAEFGDDSTMSFMTSDLQKTVSSLSAMEKSFIEQDIASEMTSSDINELSEFNENEQFFKETVTEHTIEEQGGNENVEGAVPMSFELQKELVPEMESKPERVQLESEGTSSFEQDESSSPIHTEELKMGDSNEQGILDTLPDFQARESNLPDLQEEEEPKLTGLQEPVVQLIPDLQEPTTESAVPDLGVHVKDNTLPNLEESPKEEIDLEQFVAEDRPATPKAADEIFATGGISPVPQNELGLPELEDGLSPVSSKSLQSPPQSPVLSNKSLQSPPLSPLAAKPELSLELSKELEFSPKSPLLTEKLQSPTKSPLSPKNLEASLFEMSEKSLQSPLSEVSSPIAGAAESALSTPETVPVGKDTHSQYPVLESWSPRVDLCGLTDESSEDKFKLEKVVPESDLSTQSSEFDISDLRHPLNRCQFPLPTNNFEIQAISEDLVKPLPEISVMQTPPPTPAHASEDLLASQLKENDLTEKQDLTTEKDVPITEKLDLETEKEDVKKDEVTEGTATIAAAAVAATVATAVAAGVAVASEGKPDEKKPAVADAKKPIAANKDKKGPISDKTKTTKAPATTKTAAKPKAPLTSPTKPATTAARTSTPKKPVSTTTATAASKVTKSPSTTTAKPKAAASGTKTQTTPTPRTVSTTTKPAAPSPRTRPVNTTAASKSAVLTNGDVAKTGIAKKPATTTAATKPLSRPATAPAATKTTTTKQLTSTTSRTNTISAAPRPKPGAVNGTATKPRTTGTVATATARSKVTATRDAKLVTEKQVKETANKQISSSRTLTATKSATTTTTKRVTGVTKTSVSATSTIKLAPTKTATKKATTTASSKTTTKTAVSVTATENNELVKVTTTVD